MATVDMDWFLIEMHVSVAILIQQGLLSQIYFLVLNIHFMIFCKKHIVCISQKILVRNVGGWMALGVGGEGAHGGRTRAAAAARGPTPPARRRSVSDNAQGWQGQRPMQTPQLVRLVVLFLKVTHPYDFMFS
jgi:hypothetical protein